MMYEKEVEQLKLLVNQLPVTLKEVQTESEIQEISSNLIAIIGRVAVIQEYLDKFHEENLYTISQN